MVAARARISRGSNREKCERNTRRKKARVPRQDLRERTQECQRLVSGTGVSAEGPERLVGILHRRQVEWEKKVTATTRNQAMTALSLIKTRIERDSILRYAHLSPGYLAAAVNKLDGVFAGSLPAGGHRLKFI